MLWPIFSLFELSLFAMFFYDFIKTKKAIIIAVLSGLFYIISEIVYIDTFDVKAFQSYAKIASSFLIVFIVLYKITWQLNKDEILAKEAQYLNYAIMLNFALNLLLLLPINLLVNSSSTLVTSIWISYLVITVLFYLYLSYTIWKNGKSRKRLSSGLS